MLSYACSSARASASKAYHFKMTAIVIDMFIQVESDIMVVANTGMPIQLRYCVPPIALLLQNGRLQQQQQQQPSVPPFCFHLQLQHQQQPERCSTSNSLSVSSLSFRSSCWF